MKRHILLIVLSISLWACSDDSIDRPSNDNQVISLEEMQSEVEKSLSLGKVYDWRSASDDMIWSAGMHSDSIYTIGYTAWDQSDLEERMHQVDITASEWQAVESEILQDVLSAERTAQGNPSLTLASILPRGKSEYFPQITVKLTSLELISKLREDDKVRYVEPIGFSFEDLYASARSSSGCDGAPDYGLPSADYATIAPNTKKSWHFDEHSIEQAWSSSTGNNIRIAIIDTGASDDQDNLGSQFNSGYSSGRSIQKYSTHVSGSWWWASLDSPDDPCGHGTSMAGLAAAPRGTDGNASGVAYNADLMTIRAVKDVVISSSSERIGTRDALYLAGGQSDVKVISMSIGTPFYSSTVADGIFYAYNQGKLIMAAAGTSLSWTSWYPVIFPANMTQTTAVTGIRDNGTQKCATCHDGPEVDFTIVMERANDSSRTALSLASYSNQPKYTGGSSAATATAAGIAALVWAQNPNASRATVMQSLKLASEFYPQRDDDFGWGRINALQALNAF